MQKMSDRIPESLFQLCGVRKSRERGEDVEDTVLHDARCRKSNTLCAIHSRQDVVKRHEGGVVCTRVVARVPAAARAKSGQCSRL